MTGSPSRRPRLRLYVASGAPNSVLAERNLRRVLDGVAADVELEVLDVFEHAERALEDGVVVTPVVVRVAPPPVVRLVGTLSGDQATLQRLGLLPGEPE